MIIRKIVFPSSIIIFLTIISGCAQVPTIALPPAQAKTPAPEVAAPDIITELRYVRSLAKSLVEFPEFQKAIATLKTLGKSNSRIYLARVDELSLGTAYEKMDESDLAFEDGIISGLLSHDIRIAEKLNAATIGGPQDHVGGGDFRAFYLHPIDLASVGQISRDWLSNYLLTYSLVYNSNDSNDLVAYFRFMDLQSMQLFASFALRLGTNKLPDYAEDYYNEYVKCFGLAKSFQLPDNLDQSAGRLAILDVDLINVLGQYALPPSPRLKGIEDGIISGLMANGKYPSKGWAVEKTSGLALKFSPVYDNIVFNTNPLLYEEWQEAIDNTTCTELLLYRYVPDEGLFLKLVDMKKQGDILNTAFLPFADADYQHCDNLFKRVSSAQSINASDQFIRGLQNKRVLLVDGDYQNISSDRYFAERREYNAYQFAVEEGMTRGLLNLREATKLQLKEKLKTIYLKRDWMYQDRIFNSNPLYLDSWKQLQGLGVDVLLIYNNLVPYHRAQGKDDPMLQKTAVIFRAIDVTTGDVFYTNEIVQ